MPDRQHFTAAQVIIAIIETRGLISYTAQRLGCDEQTVRNYAKRYATVKDALDTARGRMLDLGELKLMEAVNAGEGWAITFLLRTLGRDRGYGDRIDVKAEIAMTKEPESLVIDYDEYNRAYREALGIVAGSSDAPRDPPDD